LIVLYSNGCPRCNILETALNSKKISYTKVSDTDKIVEKGFLTVPILEVDGKDMAFPEAYNYVKEMC